MASKASFQRNDFTLMSMYAVGGQLIRGTAAVSKRQLDLVIELHPVIELTNRLFPKVHMETFNLYWQNSRRLFWPASALLT